MHAGGGFLFSVFSFRGASILYESSRGRVSHPEDADARAAIDASRGSVATS